MTQITSGIRSILSHPAVYDVFQNIMGAIKGRKEFADLYIQAFSGANILDIGCGTARILDFLPEGTHYYGFDISSQYINTAKEQYGDRDARFVCEFYDQSKVDALPEFDIVIAGGLLHHLDDVKVLELFELVYKSLRKGGRFVSKDPCFEAGQNPIARYMVSHDRGENVRQEAEYVALANKYFSRVEGSVRHQRWVPYTHFNMQCYK